MFHIPAQVSTPERKGRIWAKVPHENRHFKIPIFYFPYIKEWLFGSKGGLIFIQFCKKKKKKTRKIQQKYIDVDFCFQNFAFSVFLVWGKNNGYRE